MIIASFDIGIHNFAYFVYDMQTNTTLLHGVCAFDTTNTLYHVSTWLDAEWNSVLHKCDYIAIEQQLPVNHVATKISYHVYSSLVEKFVRKGHMYSDAFQRVYLFNSIHKTRIFGAPKGMTKPMRKKWCIERAMSILQHLGQTECYSDIWAMTKRDDVCDAVCQLFAFVKYYKLETPPLVAELFV
jgi:hypothetical protein